MKKTIKYRVNEKYEVSLNGYDLKKVLELYEYYKSFDSIELKDNILLDDDMAHNLIHKYMITKDCSAFQIQNMKNQEDLKFH